MEPAKQTQRLVSRMTALVSRFYLGDTAVKLLRELLSTKNLSLYVPRELQEQMSTIANGICVMFESLLASHRELCNSGPRLDASFVRKPVTLPIVFEDFIAP